MARKLWLPLSFCVAFISLLTQPASLTSSPTENRVYAIGPSLPLRDAARIWPHHVGEHFTPVTMAPAVLNQIQYSTQTTWHLTGYPQIEAMHKTITHTFSENEIAFEGLNSKVVGFRAGQAYSNIFTRDTATIQPGVQYFYPDPYLRTPVEEFLANQYSASTMSQDGDNGVPYPGAGAISATVGWEHKVDKATTTSDEETSLIHSAYVYAIMRGDAKWLLAPVRGQPAIARLNAAMNWLLAKRLDPTYHLIKRGTTTDWGDVKQETDGEVTDINPAFDHWTISIYDQAVTYRALRELSRLNMIAGYRYSSITYFNLANLIRYYTNVHLWQPERGYFLTRLHLPPASGVDESGIVSIASAVAVYTGLATTDQAGQIFRALEQTRSLANINKPGLTLYPFYNRNVFPQIQMTQGHYQNGGVWDWWGSQQITAEFKAGYTHLAREHLLQIADDWASRPRASFEWQDASSGEPWTPDSYTASSGAACEAVLNGLYGITLGRLGVTLQPRLRFTSGSVHVYQPATDLYAAYVYTFSVAKQQIQIDYGFSKQLPGSLQVLLPSGAKVRSVRLEGADFAYSLKTVGEDTYVQLSTPGGIHTVQIFLK